MKGNEIIKKYSSSSRSFRLSPCGRYYRVYIDGRLNGFIWNNDKEIYIDGDVVKSSRFFN